MQDLPAFRSEPYTDFSVPASRRAMESALAAVRAQFGREYELRLEGPERPDGRSPRFRQPVQPREIVGRHHKATAGLARQAVDAAHAYFSEYAATTPSQRVRWLLNAAGILRERKMEFDAWLVYEAGKTWPEAEADVSEAIDFCEYYAREALRLHTPPSIVQLPGERDEMFYVPLGVGVVIPPWNFPWPS